jgi:CheY-like chemotaxis protein
LVLLKVHLYRQLSFVLLHLSAGINYTNHLVPRKKTIMKCDDEQDLLQLFGLAFKSKYDVILVASGEECIDRYISEKNGGNKIDLILLDYGLGSILGDSVARKIKEYDETKIILISSYDLDDELLKELRDGKYIIKYIEKPIYVNDLLDLVSEMVC